MRIRRIILPSATLLCLLASLFVSLGFIMVSATRVSAESRYVIPSAEVVVRSNAGKEYKVNGIVNNGDTVEFIKEDGNYALVRLTNGREGWMLKRYLSVDPPPASIVASLRDENEKLRQKEQELTEQLSVASANLNKTETDLNSTVNEKNQIATDYQTLQQDTADVIKIKQGMEKATEQNTILTEEITVLKEENASLNKDKSVHWFMAGGGVLLVGIFLGRLFSNSRKRKSSLI